VTSFGDLANGAAVDLPAACDGFVTVTLQPTESRTCTYTATATLVPGQAPFDPSDGAVLYDHDEAAPVATVDVPLRVVMVGFEEGSVEAERIFAEIPDLNATLMRCSEDDETLWTEWEWTGTLSNGAPYLMRGVVIIGAREEHVTWARLYTETVERDEGADRIGSLLRRGSAQPASPSSTDE